MFSTVLNTGITTLPFSTQSRLIATLRKKPFENFLGKGEHAGNHNVFYTIKDKIHYFNNL